MSTRSQSRRWARRAPWAVPLVTVGVVLAGSQLASTASAATHPSLPHLSAARLLAAAQTTRTQTLSGTVTESAALGLPSLPGADSSASLSWQSLITGSHKARVWVGGPDQQRVALLGTLSESDIVHNGRDVWTYSSDRTEVTHTVLPAHTARRPDATTSLRRAHPAKPGKPGEPGKPGDAYTPMGVANEILKAVNPSTTVTVDPTQVVAGRNAYVLVLTPKDSRSTVRKVTIALDSTRYIPLRVQVFGKGSSPAFSIGFAKDLSFAKPAASIFAFKVPAGATVTSNPLVDHHGYGRHTDKAAKKPAGTAAPSPRAATDTAAAPRVLGTGWTSIAYFAKGLPAGAAGGLLDRATSAVGSSGDRVLKTSLLNALFTKDGRVFVGAVSPTMLEKTAAATPR